MNKKNYWLASSDSWGIITVSDNKYHDPLDVLGVIETESKLEFEVTSFFPLKDKSSRIVTVYYSLNKENAEGVFVAKVTGPLNNGVRVMRGEIELKEKTEDKLVFSYVVDQKYTWTRLLEMQENIAGEFILTADP
jgi:hypothetical protein